MSYQSFQQTLNHQAKQGDRDFGITFKQFFFSNDQFYEAGGPEFLYIGGEAPESGSALHVTDAHITPMMSWAKELKARAFV